MKENISFINFIMQARGMSGDENVKCDEGKSINSVPRVQRAKTETYNKQEKLFFIGWTKIWHYRCLLRNLIYSGKWVNDAHKGQINNKIYNYAKKNNANQGPIKKSDYECDHEPPQWWKHFKRILKTRRFEDELNETGSVYAEQEAELAA